MPLSPVQHSRVFLEFSSQFFHGQKFMNKMLLQYMPKIRPTFVMTDALSGSYLKLSVVKRRISGTGPKKKISVLDFQNMKQSGNLQYLNDKKKVIYLGLQCKGKKYL